MLKIGDFSQLGQVSVRMLRHYDELGLLTPHFIDQGTGYRYYKIEQLHQLNRILAFRDMGLSLKQIAELLQKNLSTHEVRQMLLMKQQDLLQQVQDAKLQLNRVSARLKQLELENDLESYDVIVKSVAGCWLASIRVMVPSLEEMREIRLPSDRRTLPMACISSHYPCWP